MEKLYTAKELAEALKMHIMTIYRKIDREEIKVVRIGNQIRISQAEYDRLTKNGGGE